MYKVVCNTFPIQYLFQLGVLEILTELASEVIVPDSVVSELFVGQSMGVSLPNIQSIKWMPIQKPVSTKVLLLVTDLGPGEIEVLALALEDPNLTAILDDGLARQFAKTLGIRFTGTLGILIDAKKKRLLKEITPFLDQLDNLGFHVSRQTRSIVQKIVGEL